MLSSVEVVEAWTEAGQDLACTGSVRKLISAYYATDSDDHGEALSAFVTAIENAKQSSMALEMIDMVLEEAAPLNEEAHVWTISAGTIASLLAFRKSKT